MKVHHIITSKCHWTTGNSLFCPSKWWPMKGYNIQFYKSQYWKKNAHEATLRKTTYHNVQYILMEIWENLHMPFTPSHTLHTEFSHTFHWECIKRNSQYAKTCSLLSFGAEFHFIFQFRILHFYSFFLLRF